MQFVSLTVPIATVLSKHDGPLFLNSLTKLTDQVASVLAQHSGILWLDGLKDISFEAASHLAAHNGKVSLAWCHPSILVKKLGGSLVFRS